MIRIKKRSQIHLDGEKCPPGLWRSGSVACRLLVYCYSSLLTTTTSRASRPLPLDSLSSDILACFLLSYVIHFNSLASLSNSTQVFATIPNKTQRAMAARADSNNTWSYGSSGSIWEGRAGVVTQTRPTNNDEPVWRGWQGAPRAATASQEFVERDSQHSEYGLNPVATSYSGHLPQETESTTLYMGNLEPWMDHEYISQVVRLMGWNRAPDGLQTLPVTIKISAPPIDPISHTNNPGYCLLIFPSPSHAAHILTSLQAANNRNQSGQPLLMPNSSRPFSLQWATVTQLSYANSAPTFGASGPNGPTSNSMNSFSVFPPHASQSQKEYSIFVGDLAPETSNSDLVAVFRNPVLGLRNDR